MQLPLRQVDLFGEVDAHQETGGVVILEFDVQLVGEVGAATQLRLALDGVADVTLLDATGVQHHLVAAILVLAFVPDIVVDR